MNKSLFKKIIITDLVVFILIALKLILYPYSLAPEDLRNAMRMYDEIAPIGDNFSIIMIFIIFIGYFYSLFQLYRFRKIGRQIYIIVMALAVLSVFSVGYTVYDPLEYILDCLGSIITGFITASSYFSKIAKEFK